MAHTTCEMIWLKNLLLDFRITCSSPMPMFCDNQDAIFIASNFTFHERIKHIDIDCHFVCNAIFKNLIHLPYIKIEEELADIFTKALASIKFHILCNKLGMIGIHAPA